MFRVTSKVTLSVVQAIVSGETASLAVLAESAGRNGLEARGCRIAGRCATSIAAELTITASAERSLYIVQAATGDGESYMTNTLEVALALKERPESTSLNQRCWVPVVYTSTLERVDSYELLLGDDRSADLALEALSNSIGQDRNIVTISPPRGWHGYGWPLGS